MTKWADYCISAVRYNSEHTHIVKVKVHVDSGDQIGSPTEWPRSEVVFAIENRKTFVTITRSSDGKWSKGEDVRIITVGGVKYLRTDANSKASDNLGNLPEF
jgi:hypothetical protein